MRPAAPCRLASNISAPWVRAPPGTRPIRQNGVPKTVNTAVLPACDKPHFRGEKAVSCPASSCSHTVLYTSGTAGRDAVCARVGVRSPPRSTRPATRGGRRPARHPGSPGGSVNLLPPTAGCSTAGRSAAAPRATASSASPPQKAVRPVRPARPAHRARRRRRHHPHRRRRCTRAWSWPGKTSAIPSGPGPRNRPSPTARTGATSRHA